MRSLLEIVYFEIPWEPHISTIITAANVLDEFNAVILYFRNVILISRSRRGWCNFVCTNEMSALDQINSCWLNPLNRTWICIIRIPLIRILGSLPLRAIRMLAVCFESVVLTTLRKIWNYKNLFNYSNETVVEHSLKQIERMQQLQEFAWI